jgi:hypothetical protein
MTQPPILAVHDLGGPLWLLFGARLAVVAIVVTVSLLLSKAL